MAKETKFIEVEPDEVNSTLELWQNFGWELMGAPQEIKTQDVQLYTGQDSDGTKYYKTKRGEHYVKITFQRDKSMPHYEELVQLENMYCSSPPSKPNEPEKPSAFGVVWTIVAIIGLVIYVIPGILIIIWRLVRYKGVKKKYNEEYPEYKKKCENWEKAYKDWENKCDNALKKAKSLVK